MRRSLNNGRDGTSVEKISVQSSPPEPPVMSPRGEAATTSVRVSNAVPVPSAQTVRYRRHVNVTPTVPQETMVSCFHRSHQLLPGSKSCFRVSHVFGLPSPRKVDSTDRTHIPGISRVATNDSGVVGKIATTAKMMCLYVLIFQLSSAPRQAPACPSLPSAPSWALSKLFTPTASEMKGRAVIWFAAALHSRHRAPATKLLAHQLARRHHQLTRCDLDLPRIGAFAGGSRLFVR